jgi:hypothetical protein
MVEANVSEKRAVSIFKAKAQHSSPEDGENMLLRNIGFYQSIHMAI